MSVDMCRRTVEYSLWNVISLIAMLLVAFISTTVKLSLLGTNQYGLLVILTSIIFPLGLTTLNFGQATIKYMAEEYAKKDFGQAGIYLRTTLAFNLVVGIIGTVLIWLLSPWLVNSVFSISPSDCDVGIVVMRLLSIGWLVVQIYSTYGAI